MKYNAVQENAIREANNYLKAAGLPLYVPATEPTDEQIKEAIKAWFDTPPGSGHESFPARMRAAFKAAKG